MTIFGGYTGEAEAGLRGRKLALCLADQAGMGVTGDDAYRACGVTPPNSKQAQTNTEGYKKGGFVRGEQRAYGKHSM